MQKPLHSPTGASSYYRWKECPGSIRLCEGIPKTQIAAAKLGSHAHWIAEQVLSGQHEWAYFVMTEDPELLKAVKIYIDLVINECATGGTCDTGIETSFDMSDTIGDGLYGTTDFWIFRHEDRKLTIIDYKNGKGKVNVERNEQLLFYALGALLTIGTFVETIELVICQPNYGKVPIHRWSMPVMEIFDFISELRKNLARTKDPNAELKAGSWCFFCDAARICPAKKAERELKAREDFDAI